MRRRRAPRRRATATVALLAMAALGVGLPAPAAEQAEDGSEAGDDDPLTRSRAQLDGATRSLDELRRAVDQARTALDDTEARLRVAATELASIEADLAAAEAALLEASTRERAAAAELLAATDELDAAVAAFTADRERLADLAVDAYKRGPAAGRALVGLGLGSQDLHDIAVTVHAAGWLVDEQQRTVAASRAATFAEVDARADVAEVRAGAKREAREAARVRERIAALQARQARTVAAVRAEQAERDAILAAFESDAEAQAEVVRQLRAEVQRLSVDAAAVLIDVTTLPKDGPVPAWAGALPPRGRDLAPAINAAGAGVGVDPRLLAALVWTESGFSPTAVSHAGAIGLAQLMPGTARGLGVDPYDAWQNLVGGATYLRIQLDRFGQVDLALAAYNAGPGRVVDGRIPSITETQLYVLRVLERYNAIVAATPA